MRALVQRVKSASVEVEGQVVAQSGKGLCVFVGFRHEDTEQDLAFIARKLPQLRLFEDPGGKLNLDVAEVGGELLVVPNFTLYAAARKGRRPSFSQAMAPAEAREAFGHFVELLQAEFPRVQQGLFGAHMHVTLINDGPVTVLLDSEGTC